MKRYKLAILLLCGMAVFLSACEDGDTSFKEYEGYEQIYYMEMYGFSTVDFYNVGKDSTYYLPVGKGGTDSNASGYVHVDVMTDAELQEYNALNLTSYEMLPEKFYSVMPDYELTPEKPVENIHVTLKKEIASGELDFTSRSYVLPLKISSTTGSVNENQSSLLLSPVLVTPTIAMDEAGIGQTINFFAGSTSSTSQSMKLSAGLDMTNKGWQFVLKMQTDRNKLQELVDRFNRSEEAEGKRYLLLPADCYEFPTDGLAYSEIHSRRYFEVTIKRGDLIAETDYLLPVVPAACEGMPFNVNEEEVYYIPVRVGSQMGLQGRLSSNCTGGDSNINLLTDGIYTSEAGSWQSIWYKSSSSKPEDLYDPTYGVYVDIDVSDATLEEVELKLFAYAGNNYPHHVKIYAGQDASSLHEKKNIGQAFNYTGDSQNECLIDLDFTGESPKLIRIALLTNKNNGDLCGDLRWWNNGGTNWYATVNVGLIEVELFAK